MRVLYILDPATIGGATKAFLTFVSILKNKGVIPIVCTANRTELNNELSSMDITNFPIWHNEMITTCTHNGVGKIICWSRRFLPYLIRDILAIIIIRQKINLKDIDIIHTNSTRSDVGFFLSKIFHKPHIIHIREFGDNDYGCKPLNPFWKLYYNKFSHKFLCVSKAVTNHWIAKGIDPSKCKLLYDGIAYENIPESSDESKFDERLRVVMSGSVLPTKGQYLAIKAIGSLPKEIKEHIFLDFIGWVTESERNKLISLSKDVKLVNPVRFWGARNDVLQLLKNYHIGLMCSKSEGFGLVTAEFMFAKLGIIASNTGASPELIEDNICGLNFEVGNYKSLAEKIQCYYFNGDLIVSHSIEAKKKALRLFKAQTNADGIYNTYIDVKRIADEPKV